MMKAKGFGIVAWHIGKPETASLRAQFYDTEELAEVDRKEYRRGTVAKVVPVVLTVAEERFLADDKSPRCSQAENGL